MDKRFERERGNIVIPDELNSMIQGAVERGLRERKRSRAIKRAGIGLAAALILSTGVIGVGVNTSPVFAQSMQSIPVLNALAKVMTVREYQVQEETVTIEVEVPEVSGLSDQELEERINQAIQARVVDAEAGIQQRAEEYRKAYFETGGTEEGYRPIEAEVGYEVTYADEKILSFEIYQFESLASAYSQVDFYNFDLIENRELTLVDLFGEGYETEINEQIFGKIENLKKNPDNTFFEGDMGFQGIREDQPFFINEAGQVILFFEKYEIAPGYMGRIEIALD